jgi:hypothetical protein
MLLPPSLLEEDHPEPEGLEWSEQLEEVASCPEERLGGRRDQSLAEIELTAS